MSEKSPRQYERSVMSIMKLRMTSGHNRVDIIQLIDRGSVLAQRLIWHPCQLQSWTKRHHYHDGAYQTEVIFKVEVPTLSTNASLKMMNLLNNSSSLCIQVC